MRFNLSHRKPLAIAAFGSACLLVWWWSGRGDDPANDAGKLDISAAKAQAEANREAAASRPARKESAREKRLKKAAESGRMTRPGMKPF